MHCFRSLHQISLLSIPHRQHKLNDDHVSLRNRYIRIIFKPESGWIYDSVIESLTLSNSFSKHRCVLQFCYGFCWSFSSTGPEQYAFSKPGLHSRFHCQKPHFPSSSAQRYSTALHAAVPHNTMSAFLHVCLPSNSQSLFSSCSLTLYLICGLQLQLQL